MDKKRLLIAVGGLLVALAILLFTQGLDTGIRVGICYADADSASDSAYRAALEQALKDQGYLIRIADSHQDQARQLEQILQLQKQCDILLVEPVMLSASEELLAALDSAGLPAVLLNRLPDPSLVQDNGQLAGVGIDETLPGTVLAQLLLQQADKGDLNGDGTVSYALLQGAEGSQDSTLLTDTFCKTLEQAELEGYLLSTGYTDWTAQDSHNITEQLLSAYGKDIEVILCTGSDITAGVLSAVASTGRSIGQDIYLCSIGAEDALIDLATGGKICGTVVSDDTARVNATLQAIAQLCAGQPGEWISVPVYSAVTAE